MDKTLVTLKQKPKRIVIDSELNDDWMKTLPGYQDEVAIHEQIAKDLDNGNNIIITMKGGAGSGHRGHRGRPGKRGGSLPGGGGGGKTTEQKLTTNDFQLEEKGNISLGGVNTSYKVHVENDGDAIVKPGEGNWEKGLETEVMAYELSEELGFEIVPETIKRESGTYDDPFGDISNEDASVQLWIENADIARHVDTLDADIYRRSFSQMLLLDTLLDNEDRHDGNWLVAKDGVVAIDNGFGLSGLSFDTFNSNIFNAGLRRWGKWSGEYTLKFHPDDIKAISDIQFNKSFGAEFISIFGNNRYDSFIYQTQRISNNRELFLGGVKANNNQFGYDL